MLRLSWLPWVVILAAVVSWASARAVPAGTAPGSSPFAGQTITYIVCTGPGGGYDTYARLVGRYLERHLDGARVVVRNVPGAGHLVGLRALNDAPADGLTIGTFTMGVLFRQLAGVSHELDVGRLSWIGKAAAEPRVLVVGSRSPFRTLDDLRQSAQTISFATEGVGSSAHFAASMVVKALGLRARLVPGFTEDEAQLAILRGDVTAVLASPTSLEALLAEGHARTLLRIGGSLQFDDGVPTVNDLDLSAAARGFLDTVAIAAEFGRVTAAPPGMPADRLAELRRAYVSALSDPALLDDARRLRLPIDALDGSRLEARVRLALQPPPHVSEWFGQRHEN